MLSDYSFHYRAQSYSKAKRRQIMSVLLISLIILVIALMCKLFISYHNFYQYIERLPGKPWIPIFGNALEFSFDKVTVFATLCQYYHDLGYNIFRIYICWLPQIILSHPDDVEKILSSNVLIDKLVDYRLMHPWLGDGLLTSTGVKWQRHRKIITPAFHFHILSKFLVKINENTNNVIEYLGAKHAEGIDFDVQSLVHLATLDVICDTAMGVKVEALHKSNSDIVQSVNDLRNVLITRFFSAWKRFDFLFRFSHDYKIQKKALDTMHSFTREVILKRRAYLELITNQSDNNVNDEFGSRSEIFLDILLKATVCNRPMTDTEIMDEVSTFIFEGHDTTASAISFSIYMLAQHEELQEELFREQMKIFDANRDSDSSYNELNEMKQLELFIKETLRIYPSVPLVGRHVLKGFDLNGNYIPAGSDVVIFILGIGRNPNVYENPEVFDPQRFTVDNRLNRNPYDYVPFSAGPRNCVGQKFAMLEIKTLLSKLIRNFYVEQADDKSFKPLLSCVLTLNSENGIVVKLRRRQ